MFNVLEIQIYNSAFYRRVSLLIFSLIAYLLWASALTLYVKMAVTLVLLSYLYRIVKHPRPQPFLGSLSYRQENWLFSGMPHPFVRVHVLLHTAYFQLLKFESVTAKPFLWILFSDQLATEDLKKLNRHIYHDSYKMN